MATPSRRRVEYAGLTWWDPLETGAQHIWLSDAFPSLPIASFGLAISMRATSEQAASLWLQLKQHCEAMLAELRNLPDDGVCLPNTDGWPEDEEAARFEERPVIYRSHVLPSGEPCVLMRGPEFPSLPHANFGLVLRRETTLPQARALVVDLQKTCPSLVGQIAREYPDDFPHYAAELDPERFDPDDRSLFA